MWEKRRPMFIRKQLHKTFYFKSEDEIDIQYTVVSQFANHLEKSKSDSYLNSIEDSKSGSIKSLNVKKSNL